MIRIVRLLIFKDELLSIYVVLRTPYVEGNVLQSYLSRLVIKLDAFVASAQPILSHTPEDHTAPKSPQSKEAIYSGDVKDSDDPLIVVQGSEVDDGSIEEHILIIWKLQIFLSEP